MIRRNRLLHHPVIAPDGRRCDHPVSDTDRCNLLEEEHPTLMYRAHTESAHYSFEAYGDTEAEARATLAALIATHTAQTGADPDWARSAIADAEAYLIGSGVGYRDRDQLTPASLETPR